MNFWGGRQASCSIVKVSTDQTSANGPTPFRKLPNIPPTF